MNYVAMDKSNIILWVSVCVKKICLECKTET